MSQIPCFRASRWTLSLVLLFVGGCAPPRAEPPPVPRHVILVTLDTLRADHLGTYGYPRPTSPFLDRLAQTGIQMERAYASMPTTAPSHASLFTAVHPLHHGVLKNGQVLGDSALTLAEILSREGFRSAGFASTRHHFGVGGIGQGFELLDESAPGRIYRPGRETVERALTWIGDAVPEDRLFVWVHLFDPHTPYDEANRMRISADDAPKLERHLLDRLHVGLDVFNGDVGKLLDAMELYDGEVRESDEALEHLFDESERLGLGPETLWIVAADHGEGLGNHDWYGHGKYLYEEQIRVPLLLRFGSGWGGGRRVEGIVELVDVVPTLLDVLGITPPPLAAQWSGESFLPLLLGENDVDGSAIAQRRHYNERRPARPVAPTDNYEPGETFALVTPRFKLILRTAGDDQLFDLVEDPGELNDLAGRGLPEEAALRTELRRRIRALRPAAPSPVEGVDQEALEGLKALGYVQ